VGLSQLHQVRYFCTEFRHAGGPGQETASYGWRIALNLTDASWFVGLEAFDILGEAAAVRLELESGIANVQDSHGCSGNVLV
jgi:hypothetical protein